MKSLYSYFSGLLIIIILLFFNTSNAQNTNDALRLGLSGLGSGARALGMGNSYVGLSDDASAAYYNPAGFGLIKRLEFSGGLSYLNYTNNSTFMRNTTGSSNSSTNLNRISFAFPFPTTRGSLVFGISYHSTNNLTTIMKFSGFNNRNTSQIQYLSDMNSNIPYSLYLTDTNYITPIKGNLNQSGSITGDGSIDNWTFSGAIEVYKNLFVGLNFNLISGSYKNINDYYEDDTQRLYQGETSPGDPQTRDFQTFNLNKILDWDLSGWDAKIGMIYQLNNAARLGATIQFPKTFTVKEKFTVNGYSMFGTGVQYNLDPNNYSDQVKYDILTPFELAGGFSLNVKGLIISAEGTFIDYTQLKFENGDGLSEQDLAVKNSAIKDQLRSVFNYNVGLEYTIPNIGLRLRGGYFVKPSAYKGDPSKYDKKYVTTGIGFLTDQTIGLDVAYVHGWWNDFGDNYGSNVSRTYQDIKIDYITLGVTYRF